METNKYVGYFDIQRTVRCDIFVY